MHGIELQSRFILHAFLLHALLYEGGGRRREWLQLMHPAAKTIEKKPLYSRTNLQLPFFYHFTLNALHCINKFCSASCSIKHVCVHIFPSLSPQFPLLLHHSKNLSCFKLVIYGIFIWQQISFFSKPQNSVFLFTHTIIIQEEEAKTLIHAVSP